VRHRFSGVPAAKIAERAVRLQTIQQLACGLQSEDGLSHKGGCQGLAVFRGTPFPAAGGSDQTAEREHAERRDQQLGFVRQGAGLLFQKVEQPGLVQVGKLLQALAQGNLHRGSICGFLFASKQ